MLKTERQTDRKTEKQKGKRANRQNDGQKNGQKYKPKRKTKLQAVSGKDIIINGMLGKHSRAQRRQYGCVCVGGGVKAAKGTCF